LAIRRPSRYTRVRIFGAFIYGGDPQEQQEQIEKRAAQLKEQAEQIRKVNDKVEMSWTAPQVVVNRLGAPRCRR
jgi:hypothetical protein